MTLLEGKKVLITRDASQAGSLKEKLTSLNAQVICVPTIAISNPPDWTSFDKAAETLIDFDWIVFSSVNAVSRTAARLSALNIHSGKVNGIRKAAVGSQTAKAAEGIGWPINLVPDRYQAENLLDSLLKSGIWGKKVWIPRALEARPYLVDELRSAGAMVMETPVYQNTVPYENRDLLRRVLAENDIDWITFTSSSTVTNFFKILGEERSRQQLPKLASIGAVTTKTLEQHDLQPFFTADPQNLEGLCQGLLDAESAISKSL